MTLTEKELEKFIQIACNCFRVLAPGIEPVVPGEPVIEIGGGKFLEYTGFIDLLEQTATGKICLTMPVDICSRLLKAIGEPCDNDEENLRDLVGELTSIIANNAKEHFGSGLKISVPYTKAGKDADAVALPLTRFVLPLGQAGSRAYLMIALDHLENGRQA